MIFQNQDPSHSDRLRLSKNGRGYLLGPHFTLSEMASKDGADVVLVHPCLIALLEVIRARFDKPILINSGYRSPEHNKAIGGSSASRHMYGLAADIRLPGIDPAEVASFADNELGAGGVGIYSSFTHVDIFGVDRRWSG